MVALVSGAITEMQVAPEDAGLHRHPFEAIPGGTPEANAEKFRALLDGAPVVIGCAPELKFGTEMARDSIDSGGAKVAALAAVAGRATV